MVDVSSDTTSTVASVSSDKPSAARWRVPSDLSATLNWVSGSTHPAPMMRSPRTSTAPSCSGEYGVKIVVSRSAETFASIGDRKSTRLNSSHVAISYAVFCLKKKKNNIVNLQLLGKISFIQSRTNNRTRHSV